MIAHYHTRPRDVQAIDLLDGRHLVLEDTPRYVDSQAFNLAFELVPERRAVATRRAANGRGKPKRKKERRKGGRRKKASSAGAVNGDGAERLSRRLSERTSGDTPARVPRGAEVDKVIDEVREQVDRERRDRQDAGGAEAGAKPGKGRKACPKCHMLSGARAAECGSCGYKFVPKGVKP